VKQMRNLKTHLSTLALLLLPFFLVGYYYQTRPFQDVLAEKSVSIYDLSAAQKLNIEMAAQALNGTIVKPHEEFSFNRVVGPRTSRRGYLKAPSYMEGDTPQTLGGGVCVVSSLAYQAALQSGLTIKERVAHQRTMQTIAAGLDATVWYGKADLKFENTLDQAVEIATVANPGMVTIKLLGTKDDAAKLASCKLKRRTTQIGRDDLKVEVYKDVGGKEIFVSRDYYKISRRMMKLYAYAVH